MEPVSSILVVVDRSSAALDAVSKAILLARKFKARIELFMCDAESAYELSHAYVPVGVEAARGSCIANAHAYLNVLKQSAATPDIAMTIDAACESPRYESIVRKVIRSRPDLVIKNATPIKGEDAVTFDATDWQLMRACPATLMLTRGRAWQSSPKFGAAIDPSGAESAGVARNILTVAQLLLGCVGGELDVVYAEPLELADADSKKGVDRLHDLVQEISHETTRVHVLAGNPEVSLPRFAGHRGYDAILLGALTHRPCYTAQVGTLTSKLVGALECDFILVKPSAYRSPLFATRAHPAVARGE